MSPQTFKYMKLMHNQVSFDERRSPSRDRHHLSHRSLLLHFFQDRSPVNPAICRLKRMNCFPYTRGCDHLYERLSPGIIFLPNVCFLVEEVWLPRRELCEGFNDVRLAVPVLFIGRRSSYNLYNCLHPDLARFLAHPFKPQIGLSSEPICALT
ncbi:hypothetical protein E4T56_gene8247 [Termitomyces sp. T112]|nr:hypothetical protein E4T56_gene8247 [Termitomyces sp. T112]